jgi:hypothetical protein
MLLVMLMVMLMVILLVMLMVILLVMLMVILLVMLMVILLVMLMVMLSRDSEKESTLKNFWFTKLHLFQWRVQVTITPRNRVRGLGDLYIRDPLVMRSQNM